ncbi:Hpt domain-containing protein [Pseudarthrobacter phenanthrenivorans]|uniref:Hpt domain-containing protein n=1 Tax=Pseudarthrobacter phenanthrenivorans TaxID=361575 RepID=UPI00344B53EA
MTRLADPQQFFVDPAVLSRLRGELDDDEGWFLFIQRFIAQLPFRVRKLSTGLLTGDHGLAMDAVLSLKISSQMVGAARLAGMAWDLQRCVEAAGQDHGPDRACFVLRKLAALHLVPISACADETAVSLEALIERTQQ